jgi:hypothetical protein
MSVKEIIVQENLVILDSVTFAVEFGDPSVISIRQHPMGPCFVCGPARAVLSEEQAQELIAAGVTDRR